MFSGKRPTEATPPPPPPDYSAIWQKAHHLITEGAPLLFFTLFVGDQGGLTNKKVKSKDDVHGLLAAVEALGWRLEHMNHVWVPTASIGAAGMNASAMKGSLLGQFLFRNAQAQAAQP